MKKACSTFNGKDDGKEKKIKVRAKIVIKKKFQESEMAAIEKKWKQNTHTHSQTVTQKNPNFHLSVDIYWNFNSLAQEL